MTDWLASTVGSGSLVLAVPIAVLAGLASFFSPCVMPLLPGYLSYMTGIGVQDLGRARPTRMFVGSSLFVFGFSTVFVTGGLLFGQLGASLRQYQRPISIVMGSLVIVLGLAFVGLVPMLQKDIRVHAVPAVGLTVAPLLGALFGIGWLPCTGPTLGTVLTLANNEGTAPRGAFLTLTYCLGLGIPFVLAAVGFARFMRALKWVKAHQRAINIGGGAMLIAVGVLLVSGAYDSLVFELRSQFGTGTSAI